MSRDRVDPDDLSWWPIDKTPRRIIPVKGLSIGGAFVLFIGALGWILSIQVQERHERELAKNPITRAEAESVPGGASIRQVEQLLGEPSATQPGQEVGPCIYYPWRADPRRSWEFCPNQGGRLLGVPRNSVPLLTPGAFRGSG